jgi:hypothetical protein
MTVKELMKLLEGMNPDQEVVRVDNSGGYEKIYDVSDCTLRNNFPKEGEKSSLEATVIA